MIRICLAVESEGYVNVNFEFRHRLLTVTPDCPKSMRFKIVELCARIERMSLLHKEEVANYRCRLVREKQKNDAECARMRTELQSLRAEHGIFVLRSGVACTVKEIENRSLISTLVESQRIIESQGLIIRRQLKYANHGTLSSSWATMCVQKWDVALKEIHALLKHMRSVKFLIIEVIELAADVAERMRSLKAARVCMRV